jgi:hypothetical protein
MLLEGVDRIGVGEGDGAAAEAAAGHASAEDAWDLRCRVDDVVEFGAGDAVVIAEGGVGLEHELAEAREVSCAEGVAGEVDAVLLGGHVANGAEFGVGEQMGHGDELVGGKVGEVVEVEFVGGGGAGRDAKGELGGGEGVADAGIDDEAGRVADGGHGNVLGRGAEGAVDAEGVIGEGEGGGELVHEAAGHAGELVLGALAGASGGVGVPRGVGEGEEGASEGDFEGGGTGEAAAERDVGGDGGVEGGDGRGEEWAEVEEDAEEVGRPVVRLGESEEGIGGGGAELFDGEGQGVGVWVGNRLR